MDKNKDSKTQEAKDALNYPGVALNEADDNKVTEKLQKESTCELNNNPRSNDA